MACHVKCRSQWRPETFFGRVHVQRMGEIEMTDQKNEKKNRPREKKGKTY
jgi:uncharacterized membrane protein